MIFNISKILKSEELLKEEQANNLVGQLSELNLLKIKKVVISFKDVKLVSLNFLVPIMRFLHTVDMQDLDNEIVLRIECENDLHIGLIKEAFKTVREGAV